MGINDKYKKFSITAYREGSIYKYPRWYFDDAPLKIWHEELVEGVPEIILAMTGSRNVSEVEITFSASAFKDAIAIFLKRYQDGGVVYEYTHNGKPMQGWLCPTFWAYFGKDLPEDGSIPPKDEAPPVLYVSMKVLKERDRE